MGLFSEKKKEAESTDELRVLQIQGEATELKRAMG